MDERKKVMKAAEIKLVRSKESNEGKVTDSRERQRETENQRRDVDRKKEKELYVCAKTDN